MATTADEQQNNDQVIEAKSVTKKDVINEYGKGKNYYQLADEFFGFQNEEAIARIRSIVESEIEQN